MRKVIIVLIISLLLILNSWRNILTNINTNLPGWYDELFVIWIYQNNIHHFSTFDFTNIYETNALYPFKYTLSFAEHMYFPSFLILIISFFTKNIVAQYNILLVLNHIFIFLSALLLFKKVFKNNSAALVSAFYLSFSPYFFVKVSHLQMIFFWPLLLSLYFLKSYFERTNNKSLILCGILAGAQFLSSVYLGIMNLTIIFLSIFVNILYQKSSFKNVIKQLSIILISFFIVSSVSLIGYILANREYNIKRDYGEYVLYSAHLTDYIFPTIGQASLLYTTPPLQKEKSYNHHVLGEFAVFAGFLPIIFAIYLLYPRIRKIKENVVLDFSITKVVAIGLILIITGFLLSLGPRLFVNGSYTEIPLPYDLFLKVFKPIGIIRVLARWHLLVIFGFSILLGLGYIKTEQKYAKGSEVKKAILLSLVLLFAFIEFYSLKPFSSSYKNWQADNSYNFLRENICKSGSKNILLEYPFHYRNLDGDIAKDVNYMAQILLNSTQHNCKILSGYYSYELPEYIQIRDDFANGVDEKDIKIIKDLNIDYIKFNKYAISNLEYDKIKNEGLLNQFKTIYEDNNVLILRVKQQVL